MKLGSGQFTETNQNCLIILPEHHRPVSQPFNILSNKGLKNARGLIWHRHNKIFHTPVYQDNVDSVLRTAIPFFIMQLVLLLRVTMTILTIMRTATAHVQLSAFNRNTGAQLMVPELAHIALYPLHSLASIISRVHKTTLGAVVIDWTSCNATCCLSSWSRAPWNFFFSSPLGTLYRWGDATGSSLLRRRRLKWSLSNNTRSTPTFRWTTEDNVAKCRSYHST